ncbi:MAG: hypothetical protein KGN16_23225 [Burkholderiales bacterium]|nr:hypothetical protein [Burkholderiales bacterium]
MNAALRDRLQVLAAGLRCGRSTEAAVDLPALMTDIAAALGTGAALAALAEVMPAMVAQWQREDWIALADTLEHEVGRIA